MPQHTNQQSGQYLDLSDGHGDSQRRSIGVSRLHACALLLGLGLLLVASVYFIPQSSSALFYAPNSLAYFIRGILVTIVALLWTVSPAIGPRFGAKVVLTPLAALVSVLAIPAYTAFVPILFVGLLFIVIEEEPNRRASLLGRTIVTLSSQLIAVLGLIWCIANVMPTPVVGVIPPLPWRVDIAVTLLFAATYLLGFRTLLLFRAKEQAALNPDVPVATGVAWTNERAMIAVGVPVVALLSLLFPKMESLITCLVLWISVNFVASVSRSLIEGEITRKQLRAMDRLTQQAAIGKSPTPDRLLTDYFDQCAKLILFDRGSIWLYNDGDMILQKTLEYSGKSIAFSPAARRFGEELVGRAAERSKATFVDDARVDPRHVYGALSAAAKAAMGPVTLMFVPLVASGELVGVAEFERRSIDPYRRSDRERVQSLCGLVAISLSNNRLHQDVMQQAVTDGLTGLYNKRQILKTLADEGARAQRYGKSLSVMMLDLDGFKKFNDKYGHMQGDVLLQFLGKLIRQSIRAADVAGRYGGEEFVVVMPETGREAAWVSAERIRARVEAEEFQATTNYEATIGLETASDDRIPRQITVGLTISIGVATFPADAMSSEDLLARADEALYAAKNGGRNRVCLSSYPSETLPISLSENPGWREE